jgi:hypothetical protein
MGEVYAAVDPALGRMVAIKVLAETEVRDPGWVARFEREARAVGALNHPNIVAVYDTGTADGIPFLVTELMVGETLHARIAAGPVPLTTALDYASQIARGLAAAHASGVIHRDLKPANLFVTHDGVVKILDFGVARIVGPSGAAAGSASTEPGHGTQLSALTATGAVVGTVGYMSPEQVRGLPADARSDIFGLGAVIYELVTGRRPFHGETIPETAVAILRDDPPPMSTPASVVPAAIERVVRRCLQKDPDERFQSAGDLGFALESSSLSGRAAAAPPRRRRPAMLVAAASTLALIAAGTLWAVTRTRAGTPPPVPVPDREGAIIEAGCTFSARELRGEVGSLHQVVCPADCLAGAQLLLGTDVYVASSSICVAAVHAGVIAPTGGRAAVRLEPGRPAYRGSSRNGVRSGDHGHDSLSFSVRAPDAPQDGPASPQPPAPVAAIEAGCTFSGRDIHGEIGSLHRVGCPPNCLSRSGLLLGTDSYVDSSSVCIAGIHAGVISSDGGTLMVRLEPGRRAYRGSSRNGVRADDFGRAAASFTVMPVKGPTPPARPEEIIEAGCTFTGRQLESEVGSLHRVSCPPQCMSEFRLVLGTDVYGASSSICAAAIHAGVVGAKGGQVVVKIEAGRPAYEGSYRNGVTSDDYGGDNLSFSLAPPPG